MYDIKRMKKADYVTVGEVIEELTKFPQDALFLVCGDSNLFIHVEEDSSVVNMDTEDLMSAECYPDNDDVANYIMMQGASNIFGGKLHKNMVAVMIKEEAKPRVNEYFKEIGKWDRAVNFTNIRFMVYKDQMEDNSNLVDIYTGCHNHNKKPFATLSKDDLYLTGDRFEFTSLYGGRYLFNDEDEKKEEDELVYPVDEEVEINEDLDSDTVINPGIELSDETAEIYSNIPQQIFDDIYETMKSTGIMTSLNAKIEYQEVEIENEETGEYEFAPSLKIYYDNSSNFAEIDVIESGYICTMHYSDGKITYTDFDFYDKDGNRVDYSFDESEEEDMSSDSTTNQEPEESKDEKVSEEIQLIYRLVSKEAFDKIYNKLIDDTILSGNFKPYVSAIEDVFYRGTCIVLEAGDEFDNVILYIDYDSYSVYVDKFNRTNGTVIINFSREGNIIPDSNNHHIPGYTKALFTDIPDTEDIEKKKNKYIRRKPGMYHPGSYLFPPMPNVEMASMMPPKLFTKEDYEKYCTYNYKKFDEKLINELLK